MFCQYILQCFFLFRLLNNIFTFLYSNQIFSVFLLSFIHFPESQGLALHASPVKRFLSIAFLFICFSLLLFLKLVIFITLSVSPSIFLQQALSKQIHHLVLSSHDILISSVILSTPTLLISIISSTLSSLLNSHRSIFISAVQLTLFCPL